ncbi:MAG: hypothetical protein ACI8QZ_001256 [Chlamydiales bacterium]|jgi:hypothetical protein
MRRVFLVAVTIGTSLSAFGQELIPNPSFEQFTCCPSGPSEITCSILWTAPTLGSSDYFNACDTSGVTGVPLNALGFQDAFHGDAYAAFFALSDTPIGYREYVQTPILGTGLESGKTYRFSMQLSLAEDSSVATDRIGAYLSDTAISAGDYFNLPYTPQFETPAGTFLTDILEWIELDGTFVAEGGEQFVTIGNFHDATSSASIPAGLGPDPPLHPGSAYYYLDMVSLQCEPCVHPPDDLLAWWTLDELSGTTAYEVIYGLHGTHIAGPTPTPGYVDTSLAFLASGVSIPTAMELELDDDDFSIVAWVKVDALGTDQTLFAKSPPIFTGAGYTVVVNTDGTVGFTMVDASLASVTATSTVALAAGEWSQIVVGVDRSEIDGGTIWIDGIATTFDPTPAPGSLTNALPLRFAQDGGAGVGLDLIGGLDEVQIFFRALQPLEVELTFDSHTSGQCKIYTELEPVIGIPFTPILVPTVTTTGNLINGTGLTGTFTVAVRGEPSGTRCGKRRSTVDGPINPRILSQQPIQVAPESVAPVLIELDNPRNLGGGLACYSVTATHIETGRTFRAVGGLQGPRGRNNLRPH